MVQVVTYRENETFGVISMGTTDKIGKLSVSSSYNDGDNLGVIKLEMMTQQ